LLKNEEAFVDDYDDEFWIKAKEPISEMEGL
jgi:hypothetical protein